MYGVKEGIFEALSSSVLFLAFGHFHSFTWQQYFLDYPIALSVVAIAGFYHKKLVLCDCNCESRTSYLIKGMFFGALAKYFVNVLSTYIFIEHYFEELVEHNITIFDSLVANSGVIFSLIYNVVSILPSVIITAFILLRMFKVYGNRILEKV
jgi:thiamine transporter ThiT